MSNGADILVNGLGQFGVRHLFGMPGSHSTTIYDAMPSGLDPHDLDPQRAGRRLRRGWLRAGDGPGRRGVHDGRSGRDQRPDGDRRMLGRLRARFLLAGQVNAATLDRECGNYHEIDLDRIFQPVTKWCGTVRRVEDIPRSWAGRSRR